LLKIFVVVYVFTFSEYQVCDFIILTHPDNITVDNIGNLYIAEDQQDIKDVIILIKEKNTCQKIYQAK